MVESVFLLFSNSHKRLFHSSSKVHLDLLETLSQSFRQCTEYENCGHKSCSREQIEHPPRLNTLDNRRKRFHRHEHKYVGEGHDDTTQLSTDANRQQLPDQCPRNHKNAQGTETNVAEDAHENDGDILRHQIARIFR